MAYIIKVKRRVYKNIEKMPIQAQERSVAVKARHIKKAGTRYHYFFKKTTPGKVLSEISSRYSKYLKEDPDELIDISTTDWYKEMEKKMKPKDYLKNLREVCGFTQKQLGEKINTNAAHISDFETGQREISKNIAKRLSKIFNVNPGVFI